MYERDKQSYQSRIDLFLLYIPTTSPHKRYKPEWSDLDTRPLPQWYDQAKVGIFLHWGIYSAPGYSSEWFWRNWEEGDKDIKNFMAKNYPPQFTYQSFAPMFTAEFFDPKEWTDLFVRAGAKYVVLTTKHHDGYTLFPSRRSFSWNAVDVAPKRDLVGELATAIKKADIKFGAYHSLYEWYNPIYLEDGRTHFKSRKYPDTKVWPDLKQIIEDYKPSIIWSDGDQHNSDTYWNSTYLLAWLYNDSPVNDEVVVNDRWGAGTANKHGDFYNGGDANHATTLQPHKWEDAFTLDGQSWGYRRNINVDDIMTLKDMLGHVVRTVSCGGNALINIGPTKEGTISPIFQERLLGLGNWLKVNGDAIYNTSPWYHQKDSYNGDVWYTCHKYPYNASHPTAVPSKTDNVTAFYAITLQWPSDNKLKMKDAALYLHTGYHVQLLDDKKDLKWEVNNGVASIELPDFTTAKSVYAWALKFTH